MKTKKIFGYGTQALLCAIAVILALAVTGCESPIDSLVKSDLTGSVSLSNQSPKVGESITATYARGNGTGAQTWQWFRVGTGTEDLIPGATTNAYTATADDVGKKLKAQLSFDDQNGSLSATTTNAVTAAAVVVNDITYTVQANGANNTTTTTEITFTFSVSVDSLGLTAADITVVGATKGATLTGTGTTRTLAVTVEHAGQATVTITKTGIEAGTKNVTVYKAGEAAPTLTGITITTSPSKTTYTQGETLDLTGLVVTATYSDTTTAPVTSGYTASPANGTALNTVGTAITVTVTYQGQTADFAVTVQTPTVTNFTVTFDADGGTPAPQPQTVAKDGKATAPAPVTKTGYGFGGWFTDNTSFADEWDFAVNTVTANITLYAKWDTTFYAVTFSADGGDPAPEEQSIAHGAKATAPPAMTKGLYTFDGWYKEAAFTTKWDFATDTVTAAVTLYAKWISPVTVTFSADGGDPAPEEQRIAHDAKVTAPPAMTKANHTFGGWFTDNTAFANQWDFAENTVTADITLYAKWELNRYTVTFNADGGTSAPEDQTVAHGAQATKPATDPAKANDVAGLYVGTPPTHYTFDGWQKDGAAYDFDTPVTADITLTAKWTAPTFEFPFVNATNIIGQSVAYINADSTGITAFTLMLDDNVPDVAGIIHNKDGVTLTITSMGETPVVISKGGVGTLLTVNNGATLVIDGYVTLQGISNNTYSLVTVGANSKLELKGNAKITGNTSNNSGSGVAATGTISGGLATVTMSGNAEISGNTSTQTSNGGGGVHLVNYASLTMDGNAAIKNNTVSTTGDARGGGVTISSNSTFTMNGGEISGNNATGTGNVRGGGVFLFNNATTRFSVASEAVKRNIKNNNVTAASGTAEGAQVYKWNNSVFEVDGVAQDDGTAKAYDSWD